MAESAAADQGRYVVVARRYRPRGFDQLVGQEHVARALANAIETRRVGHAYLFTGARGVGKTSTARIFAKALNAPEGPTAQPDDRSDICQAIDAGEDIDVLEIDGASNRGIEEIRQLRAGVGVRPSRARYKIYIIDEVHMLTTPAFNALLKTLEEPPEHVKFIFCTTDPEKIPITVLSRCQRFDFAPVRMEAIAGRLREIVSAEGAEVEDEALRLLARRAAGSMRDSQSLLEQVLAFSSGPVSAETVHAMLGTADDARLAQLGEALCRRDSALALQRIDESLSGGVDAGQLSEQLLGFFRDMMTACVGCDAEMLRYCGPAMHEQLKAQGAATGLQTILAIVALLDQALVRIRQSVHGQILLEAAAVQICALPDLEAVAKLATALAGGTPSAAGGEKKKGESLSPARGGGGVPAPHWNASAPGPPAAAAAAGAKVAGGEQIAAGEDRAAGLAPTIPHGDALGDSSRAGSGPGAAHAETASSPATATGGDAASAAAEGRASGKRTAAADSTPPATGPATSASGPQRPADGADPGAESCQGPGSQRKLQAGGPTGVARDVHGGPAGGEANAPRASGSRPSATANRRQRMREAEQHPGVRQVIEMFEAEIIRVDEPRASVSSRDSS